MRTGFRALFFGALFSIGFVGCSCGDDQNPDAVDPRPEYSRETIDFEALCAGQERREELIISNRSGARLDAQLSFEGPSADNFRVEREGEVITELVVAGNRSEVVEVVYEPTGAAGLQEVWLVVDTNSKRSPQQEIFLTARFSSNPTAPRIGGTWALCADEHLCHAGNEKEPCCQNPAAADGGLASFGHVGVEQESQLLLALESTGCEAVRISAAELSLDAGESACREADVSIELPEGGLELPGTVDVGRHQLPVSFRPAAACALGGTLTLQTTDPERPTLEFQLMGEGRAGSLRSFEPFNFGEVHKGDYNEIDILLVNQGADGVSVDTIEIRGDDAEHFQMVRAEQCGAEVADLPLEVVSVHDTCRDPNPENCEPGQPPECASQMVLVTRYEPQSSGTHGMPLNEARARYVVETDDGLASIVRMHGSSLPRLQPYPSAIISFGNPLSTGCGTDHDCGECLNATNAGCSEDSDCGAGERCLDALCTSSGSADSQALCATSCGNAVRTFSLCNEGGYNDLVISGLSFFDLNGDPGSPTDNFPNSATFGEPIFSLDAGNCLDGPIEAGACCEGAVHLLDNHGGGDNFVHLHIESNRGQEPRILDVRKQTTSVLAPVVPSLTVTPAFSQPGSPVTVRADPTAQHGTVTNYVWEVFQAPGQGTGLHLPLGFIDPRDPDKVQSYSGGIIECPKSICYELLNSDLERCSSDGSDCSVLRFHPDIRGRYTYSVTAVGSVCDEPLQTVREGETLVDDP